MNNPPVNKKTTASVRNKRADASRYKIISLLTAVFFAISVLTLPSAAAQVAPIEAGSKTAAYLLQTVSEPYPGDVGGEWVIAAFRRAGTEGRRGIFKPIYDNLIEFLNECDGVISTRKYAEYSKTIYGVTAAGYDARSVADYDLTLPLGDYDMTVLQGINGPIWALIALDSGNYTIQVNPDAQTQAKRELYLEYILSRELEGGGFSMMGKFADPDITAMALQALSKYTDREDVAAAVKRALNKLSELQQPDGGYKSMGDQNAESTAQVILALCRLGISLHDPRFMKNGYSPLDNLLTFRNEDGSYCHLMGDGGNMTATEQAFSALAALTRIRRAQLKQRPALERTLIFKAKTGRYKGILYR
jgi:hypothetical protein